MDSVSVAANDIMYNIWTVPMLGFSVVVLAIFIYFMVD